MEQVNHKSIVCHQTNFDHIIIIVKSGCVFCFVASSLILVRSYGSMWSCWSAREKKSSWREPEWWMHSLSVWKRVNNNVPSCCRQVCELHMNITEQLTPTLPYSCSHLIDLIICFLFSDSVQEMSQMQIKLQQALSAKALSENMNKVLQVCPQIFLKHNYFCDFWWTSCTNVLCFSIFTLKEDMADLKEQIALYESAVKHGVIVIDLSSNSENQLSESCVDLGLKKTNRKNGTLNR